jgi:hypothetical protein
MTCLTFQGFFAPGQFADREFFFALMRHFR